MNDKRAAGEPYYTIFSQLPFCFRRYESLNHSCGSPLRICFPSQTCLIVCAFGLTCFDSQLIILCCVNSRAIIKGSFGKGVSLAFIAKANF